MTPPITEKWAFVLDFDGTITTKDTISTLAHFGIATQAAKGRKVTIAWDEIVARYGEDFSGHSKRCIPSEQRNTLDKEVSYYRSLKGVERRSFDRVSASGLFSGIGAIEWEQFGRDAVRKGDIVLREGLRDFMRTVKEFDGVWGVVSVNFSKHFIRGVLGEACDDRQNCPVEILANHPAKSGEIQGPAIGNGECGSVMLTSDDKLLSMRRMLQLWTEEYAGQHLSRTIYIGDSGTDIECLTEYGVMGIVMSGDGKSNLIQTLKRVGMEVVHVEDYQEGRKSLYWARDFQEILCSPLGSMNSS